MKRFFWIMAAVVVGVAGVLGAVSVMGEMAESATRAEAEELRDEVREVRSELELCLDELDEKEWAFRSHERSTQALRDRVESFETMDERGVPSERYDEYLETFDRYNESLPEWERLGAELEELSRSCRLLAEEHNLRADSLAAFLVQEGLWDESWRGGPPPTDEESRPSEGEELDVPDELDDPVTPGPGPETEESGGSSEGTTR